MNGWMRVPDWQLFTTWRYVHVKQTKKVKSILCDINSSQNETIFLTLTHSIGWVIASVCLYCPARPGRAGREWNGGLIVSEWWSRMHGQSKDERNIKTDKFNFYFYGSFHSWPGFFLLLFYWYPNGSSRFILHIFGEKKTKSNQNDIHKRTQKKNDSVKKRCEI